MTNNEALNLINTLTSSQRDSLLLCLKTSKGNGFDFAFLDEAGYGAQFERDCEVLVEKDLIIICTPEKVNGTIVTDQFVFGFDNYEEVMEVLTKKEVSGQYSSKLAKELGVIQSNLFGYKVNFLAGVHREVSDFFCTLNVINDNWEDFKLLSKDSNGNVLHVATIKLITEQFNELEGLLHDAIVSKIQSRTPRKLDL